MYTCSSLQNMVLMRILMAQNGSSAKNVRLLFTWIALLVNHPLDVGPIYALSFHVNPSFSLFFSYVSLQLCLVCMIQFFLVMPKVKLVGHGPKQKSTKRKRNDDSSDDERRPSKPPRKRGSSHKNCKLNQWPTDNLLPCLNEYNLYVNDSLAL